MCSVMGHQFTIEGDEAFALAQDLAALTGETLDAAVTAALRDRVEAERKRRDMDIRVADVLEIAREIRTMIGDPAPDAQHGHLYDYLRDNAR